MTRIYGHRWSSLSVSDDGTWLMGLRGVSPDQVAAGLSELVKNHSEWPPTLPEFRGLCLGQTSGTGDRWEHQSAAYKIIDPSKALPQMKAQKSVANAERKKLIDLGIIKNA